jgi:hypothetical protein
MRVDQASLCQLVRLATLDSVRRAGGRQRWYVGSLVSTVLIRISADSAEFQTMLPGIALAYDTRSP